jgi:hypothetical protein
MRTQDQTREIVRRIFELTKDNEYNGKLTFGFNRSREHHIIKELKDRKFLFQKSESRRYPTWKWNDAKKYMDDSLALSIHESYANGAKSISKNKDPFKQLLAKYKGITPSECKLLLEGFGYKVIASKEIVKTEYL